MRRRRVRAALGWLRVVLALALALVWWTELRPQELGGPADYVMVSGTSMLPTMRTGDLVVVRRAPAYAPGDVVAYRVPEGDVGAGHQVIHRITGGSGDGGYVLQGDNRSAPDTWRPTDGDVIGEAWVRIPRAGIVLQFVRNPFFVGPFAAFMAAGLVLIRRRPAEDPDA
ncbi:MAG TPA: signal peptidase I [Gaiellaceae bacterium]|nr:signal peptidase I [Gaiellaceae bacterium]